MKRYWYIIPILCVASCCLKVSDHGEIKEYYGMFTSTDSGDLRYTFADPESGKAIVR